MFIFSTEGRENSCPVCNFKLSEFITHQKLGCSYCYLFLEKGIKNLTSSVQDGAAKHIGKKPKNKKKLLQDFILYAIDQESKSGESPKEDCDKLKKILREYF
jgi:protein-arginine kinase activator protein McsA